MSPSSAAVRMVAPDVPPDYRALRQIPLFEGLPNQELHDAIVAGDLAVRFVYRDDIIVDEETVKREGTQIFLVKSGQAALAVFAADVLAEEQRATATATYEEKMRKVRTALPVIRRADKNLATFGEGDLWNSGALAPVD